MQCVFKTILAVLCLIFTSSALAADNTLTDQEKKDGWIQLFDGKSFNNWKIDKWNPDAFAIENDSIKCYGKASMIYYHGPENNFKDFHFSATVMTKKGANSGIFFHTKYQDKGWPVGHEAQVNCTQRDPVKTGSVYIVKKFMGQAHKDDEWFHYEIIVKGKTVITKVNGKTVVTYTEGDVNGKRKLSSGTFGLQAHDPGSTVFYKNIKVKPLASTALSRAEMVAGRSGQWYNKMDFGPALAATTGIGNNIVLKGLSVRVGPGESHTMIYDTEMMSFNGAKEGFLNIRGTAWDGRHGGYPSAPTVALSSQNGPGWAKGDDLSDPREVKYGPIPREWAKYKGHYRNGSDVVIKYTVGNTEVLEHPAYEEHNGVSAYTRTLNIGNVSSPMTMMVLRGADGVKLLGEGGGTAKTDTPSWKPGLNVVTHRTASDWDSLAMGVPSTKDNANKAKIRFTQDAGFAAPHDAAGANKDSLPRLTDGKTPRHNDDIKANTWFDGKKHEFTLNLKKVTDIARINVYSWHKAERAPQRYTLSASADGKKWTEIAKVDTTKLGKGGKHGVSLFNGKGTLGKFQYLKWSMPNVGNGTFFSEIDVFDSSHKLPPVKNTKGGTANSGVTIAAAGGGIKLRRSGNDILADIAAGQQNFKSKIIMSVKGDLNKAAASWPAAKNVTSLTNGGKLQWPETFAVKGVKGATRGPYSTEEIPLPPGDNPWQSKIRFSGFDFFADGKRAAICTWNGDVWVVTGIDKDLQNLTWKRYAAGLFETLGLKIVDDVIYVTCKDQIAKLHDLNNDGEADFYECFNNDIMITTNFHEFTFSLQTDKEGNFYFAKGAPVRAGGRNFETTHANHGVVFKVSKDGKKSEVWANGLRAPGGVGVGPNGEVTTGENEGTYVPACKINWCTKGSFNGVILPSHGRTMADGYNPPLCWMPMYVDNSGGGQVWVDNDQWGPFNGDLLHLSYGRSKIYKVMKQEVDGVMQGGVFELPIRLSSSAMRARFNPVDKQLYVSGFRGWQTNAAKESALQRIRYNGKKVATPKEMKVTKKGIYLTFTQKLDKELAEDKTSYSIKWWNYVWGPQYGSAHFSVNNVDEAALKAAMDKESKAGGTRGSKVAAPSFKGDDVPVKSAKLLEDGKTVFLEIPGMRTVMQMEISVDVETEDGDEIITKIYNSIHKLADK